MSLHCSQICCQVYLINNFIDFDQRLKKGKLLIEKSLWPNLERKKMRWLFCWGFCQLHCGIHCFICSHFFHGKIMKQNCLFSWFWKKNEKWPTLKWKISVTKIQKTKIWDDRCVGFFVGYVMAYSIFSVGPFFMEKIVNENSLFSWFFKKMKNDQL